LETPVAQGGQSGLVEQGMTTALYNINLPRLAVGQNLHF
jgi:hypothetical protein